MDKKEFERAQRRYLNHNPMPQAKAYVEALEARVAELEAERERDKKLMRYMEYVIRSLKPAADAE